MTKILFLDESGDHSLAVIDPQHPVFVLGGIIVDWEYAHGEMTDKINKFKLDLFGTNEITLHTADFTRQRNGFEQMKDREFCEHFYRKLNQLIAELDVTVIACAVQKQQHMEKYGLEAVDPYLLSLNVLVERFCFTLGNAGVKGVVIAEARDSVLDRLLELAWLEVKISGTNLLQAVDIKKHIESLVLKNKKDKIAGLEMADAIVTPIARAILNKRSRVDLEIIKSKMRKNHLGEIDGHGLVVLPKK